MVCKNALSNIYFKLGEFHELKKSDCLLALLEPLALLQADAHSKFGSIQFILRYNVYNLFNSNPVFLENIEKLAKRKWISFNFKTVVHFIAFQRITFTVNIR